MKPRSIVFDLYGDYLRYRGGAARSRVLVELMSCFEVGDSTVRVVLARLRNEGWFEARKEGRETWYELNRRSTKLLDDGRARIFNRADGPWDRTWRMVIYAVPESDRGRREKLRKDLAWLGFGPLAPSTYVSPHDRLDAVREHLSEENGIRLDTLTCQSSSLQVDQEMAARCWDLPSLNADYAELIGRYRPRMARYRRGVAPRDALVERMQFVHDYRIFPFKDPDLPADLLPKRWRGREAHELFLEAHDLLRAPAEAYVDEVLS